MRYFDWQLDLHVGMWEGSKARKVMERKDIFVCYYFYQKNETALWTGKVPDVYNERLQGKRVTSSRNYMCQVLWHLASPLRN